MRFRTLVVAALAPSALVVASCGGGGGNAKVDFIAKADAICTTRAQQANKVAANVGPVQSASDAQKLTANLLQVDEAAVHKIKALSPPSDVSSQFKDFVSQVTQSTDEVRRGNAAAKRNDEAAYSQAQAAQAQDAQRADAIGAKIGFQACAERLPSDQQDAVRQVIVRTSTTDDPAQCTDDFTAAFVEQQWGSVSKCRQAQQSGAATADKVDITKLSGVGNATAYATVKAHGGRADGNTLSAFLVYEDGRWKLNSVGQAQGSSAPQPAG